MKRAVWGLAALILGVGDASATSISPLVAEGVTFADKKAQMIVVANAYSASKKIILEAFEPDLHTPAAGVRLEAETLTLSSNGQRRLRVIFDVPGDRREIAICARTEQTQDEMVIPRVCGRYLARRAGLR